ncbi:hypothetical protein HY995_00400 [Candidatus Micrarchaeota archaeon]|nr:hypothetical protein [Candidatus Micrarchaeota archaeon]
MNISQMVAEDIGALKGVLSSQKYLAGFLVGFAIVLLFYAVFNDILVINPPFSINPDVSLTSASLVLIISFLTSLLLVVFIHNAKRQISLKSSNKAGLSGSLLAAFGTACPVCQPIWLVWLGLASPALALVKFALAIQLASIVILIVSLHFSLREVSLKTCPIK